MDNRLIIIAGPTAVGKTELSIELAKKINGEIISADSMQVYKGLDIATAKIKEVHKQGIKHYLIDILEPFEEFNIKIFKDLAKLAIKEIYAKNKIPILVGGTGFYIQALLYDIDFETEDDEQKQKLRKSLEKEYEEKGADYMLEKLSKLDIDAACFIHKNNKKRIIRALEYNLLNGKKISEHNFIQGLKKSEYDYRYFVLTMNRQALYNNINKRVDLMFEEGLLEEFRKLLKKGIKKDLISMQGIGYKEQFLYLENKLTLAELKEEIKKNTRHFAKRQLTWFKRENEVIYIDKDKYSNNNEILELIIKFINFKNV